MGKLKNQKLLRLSNAANKFTGILFQGHGPMAVKRITDDIKLLSNKHQCYQEGAKQADWMDG